MKMISDVVREDQRQLVNFATAGVAFALTEYPILQDCSEDERKDAWSTFFGMDPCYTATLLFARESKIIDFYGIFAGAGGEAVKWQEYFRKTFVAVCEVCLEHRIVNVKSSGLSAALVSISLQEWRDEIGLDLSTGGLVSACERGSGCEVQRCQELPDYEDEAKRNEPFVAEEGSILVTLFANCTLSVWTSLRMACLQCL